MLCGRRRVKFPLYSTLRYRELEIKLCLQAEQIAFLIRIAEVATPGLAIGNGVSDGELKEWRG